MTDEAIMELIAEVAHDSPDVVRLAELVSPAVRFEAELLRAVRIECAPDLGADVEGHLWFCPLVSQRGRAGITIRNEIIEVLRDRLRKRWQQPENRQQLQKARDAIEHVHADISPAIKLEEKIAWAHITSDQHTIDFQLSRAVNAMDADDVNMMIWVSQAAARLPNDVARTTGGWILRQYANAAGGPLRLTHLVDADVPKNKDLAALFTNLPLASLRLRRRGGILELGDFGVAADDRGVYSIQVPDTDPRLLTVETSEGNTEVDLPVGQFSYENVPAGETIRLVTRRGDVYELGASHESPVGETGTDEPYFVLSFAPEDDCAELRQFYDDLRVAVGRLVEEPVVAYLDIAGISGRFTNDFTHPLREALQTCQLFVPLCSPAYFESEYCGKQWAAFESRISSDRRGDASQSSQASTTYHPSHELSPWIQPVHWETGRVPDVQLLNGLQQRYHPYGEDYVKNGVLGLVAQQVLNDYHEFVEAFAINLIRAAELPPPSAQKLPDYDQLVVRFPIYDLPVERDTLWIVHTSKDQRWADQLRMFLTPVVDPSKLIFVDGRTMTMSDVLGDRERLKVVIALVSPSFVSGSLMREFDPVLQMAQTDEIFFAWIAVEPNLEQSAIDKFQSLNGSKKSLQQLNDAQRGQILTTACRAAIKYLPESSLRSFPQPNLPVEFDETPGERRTLFLSYHERDAEWIERIMSFLAPVLEELGIEVWDKTRIAAGSNWQDDISAAMLRAQVALVLVSPDYLAEDYVLDEELPQLAELQRRKRLQMFPVLVRSCPWESVPALEGSLPQVAEPIGDRDDKAGRREIDRLVKDITKSFRDAAPATTDEPSFTQLANPFITGSPVPHDSPVRILRKKFLAGLSEMVTSGKSPIVLTGMRRVGKTSLLRELPDILGDDFAVAYFDCLQLASETEASIMHVLSMDISAAVNDRGGKLTPVHGSVIETDPDAVFGDWLLEFPISTPRVVICFDEYDALPKSASSSTPMHSVMRLIIGDTSATVILAGERDMMELGAEWEKIARQSLQIAVPFFTIEECLNLFNAAVPQVEFEEGSLEEIVASTGGFPVLVHFAGAELIRELNEQQTAVVTTATEQTVIEHVLRQADDLLKTLLESAGPALREPLIRAATGASIETSDEMRQLQKRRFLDKSGEFTIPMFREWLLRRFESNAAS